VAHRSRSRAHFRLSKLPEGEGKRASVQHGPRAFKKEPADRLCAGPAGHFIFALSTNATSERAYAN
jgi:hypothetical protein